MPNTTVTAANRKRQRESKIAVFSILLIALLFATSGCGNIRRVSESRVLTNLQNEFPTRTFELSPGYKTEPLFGIGFDTFGERQVPVWSVHELDTDTRFQVLDGSERGLVLRSMVDGLIRRWTNEVANMIYEVLHKFYPPEDITHGSTSGIVELRFYNDPAQPSGSHPNIYWGSRVGRIHIEGLDEWLLDISNFEEGFVALANYDRVYSMRLSVRYNIIVDEEIGIDIETEAMRKEAVMRNFILPIYDLLYDTDAALEINISVFYVSNVQDERGRRTTLGSFRWGYDSTQDARLTGTSIDRLSLREHFEST